MLQSGAPHATTIPVPRQDGPRRGATVARWGESHSTWCDWHRTRRSSVVTDLTRVLDVLCSEMFEHALTRALRVVILPPQPRVIPVSISGLGVSSTLRAHPTFSAPSSRGPP